MTREKNYTERDSPFFRLHSRAKLARLLFIGLSKLRELSGGVDLYYVFQKRKANGKFRKISAPRDDLKRVQKRIADLLQRIKAPEYLFAPVQGRSYVDNAAVHIGAAAVQLLDIEDFFPSCTANKVIWFFRRRLECSEDIAVILKTIVTREGSLPQGSPCSPILAYLCYVDMWTEIEKAVQRSGCRLSVYADDVTISGDVVPAQLVWDVKSTMRKHGHNFSREKERSKFRRPAEVTGVIVANNRMTIPNRQHKSILDAKLKLKAEKRMDAIGRIQRELKGRSAQVNQINSHPRQPA